MRIDTTLRRSGSVLVGALLFVAIASGRACAYDPTARISMSGQAGIGGYDMGDVNREIARGNEYLAGRDFTKMDPIRWGFNFVGDLRARVRDNWSLSIGGGVMSGRSRVDFDQVIEVEPSASYLQAKLLYDLPWRPIETLRLSVGGGVIDLLSAGLTASHEQRPVDQGGTQRVETLEIKSSGLGAIAVIEAELIISESITLVTDLGWRQVAASGYDSETFRITRLSTDEGFDSDGDGIPDQEDISDLSYLRSAFGDVDREGDISKSQAVPGIDFDFSGATANVGLRFYLF